MRRAVAVAIVLAAAGAALIVALRRRGDDEGARCGPGFEADGARCLVTEGCPAPLAMGPHGCDAPDVRVLIPDRTIAIGPSDWEAEGRVTARAIHVPPFRIDAFEVTRGAMGVSRTAGAVADVLAAASDLTLEDAMSFCASRGGRLPTEDEWIVAAVSAESPPRRYPWGDTGAVCRRGAWGLVDGPCSHDGVGPDTVGAHPDGDSALGVHDLAGNVAEWVTPSGPALAAPAGPAVSLAKGGSWATSLAADLRVWARRQYPQGWHDPRVGFRCVYAP